ncbi:MAG: NADH-quinone oxidoreductase subunit C [Rhodocyclaceae bacterium]|nr:NADH-quinone oxidoreductase subunit C [Rhodocyclaceae bacterium]
MRIGTLELETEKLALPLSAERVYVRPDEWTGVARAAREAGGRLLALWGSDRRRGAAGDYYVSAAYALADGMLWVDLALDRHALAYPDLSAIFPSANRMQRATADLYGFQPAGAADTRAWLDHGAWEGDAFPLRQGAAGDLFQPAAAMPDYPFVRVEGEGVHEIPVGPVHAGIIEPGHFRFSIVGEKVLRLEERLGYKHKGIDLRFTQIPALDAHRLAGRVSGDSTVAFAWAYCMALEAAARLQLPPRAQWLRALMLERERVANHLGDLGALGNDAALGFGLAQFLRLKEDWLRISKAVFGHRFMMDCVVPGGVAQDLEAAHGGAMVEQCQAIEREVSLLRRIYDDHSGLQDRFITTGRVRPELARELGLVGFAARASGVPADLRCDYPIAPYDLLAVRRAGHQNGDVAARAAVRFDEIFESLRLIREMLLQMPGGDVRVAPELPAKPAFGAGWIEGWRGEVVVALELDGTAGEHALRRCHCHDPSWQNWPVLEHAIMGNIVPDFPLINKSFNLSYAGADL